MLRLLDFCYFHIFFSSLERRQNGRSAVFESYTTFESGRSSFLVSRYDTVRSSITITSAASVDLAGRKLSFARACVASVRKQGRGCIKRLDLTPHTMLVSVADPDNLGKAEDQCKTAESHCP